MTLADKKFTIAIGAAAGVSGLVAVLALRQNSQTSQELYNDLIAADQSGVEVEDALVELQGYIYAHMNTSIGSENGIRPPIQLQGTYGRLVSEAQLKAEQANATVYDRAQATCEAQFGGGQLRSGRVQCVADYVEQNTVEVKEISPDLYRFDFQPPLWSPDLAGFAVVTTIILTAILLFRGFIALFRRVL